jgi:molybdopterin molybdotransferase
MDSIPQPVAPRKSAGERSVSKGLPLHEAIETILASVSPLEEVTVPLADAADAVLASDITARDDVPSFNNSAMDGFAVRHLELEKATESSPVGLRIAGDLIAAGRTDMTSLAHQSVLRIMTGAMIPSGADAVVPQEHVRVEGETAFFTDSIGEGRHIRRAGEDLRAGSIALPRGAELTPGALAVAGAAGQPMLSVHRRARVAILASGDELIAPDKPMKPGLVRNTNSLALKALVEAAGCECIDLGIARDDRLDIAERVSLARRADAIITSGGVSVGERDLMRSVLESEGLKVKFWRVHVKPGKPFLFGMLDRIPVFGLPGNPVATHVAFELMVRPALRRMCGHTRLFRPVWPVKVAAEIRRAPGRPEFLRVQLERKGKELTARPTTSAQGSHLLSSMLGADALLYLDAETILVPRGEELQAVVLWGREEAEFGIKKPGT